jgi:hypothetical protein
MGLYVNSVSDIPLSESRAYYIYVLDYYNWDEPISNTLKENAERIAAFCSENDAVMVKGLPNSHLGSEVLSWVKINGQNPGMVLPALLITAVHPQYFVDSHDPGPVEGKSASKEPFEEISDSLIFLKIRDICKNPVDVVVLLEKIFHDIKQKHAIKDFTIVQEQRKGEHGALVDALILEPSFAGLGVDIKKLVNWARGRISS